jgi:host factor-I protein
MKGEKGGFNLQDIFLNQVRKEKAQVTIYLTNGYQFKGKVVSFDAFTILMNSEGKQMLVYKHAVSTITPLTPLSVDLNEQKPPETTA